MFGLNWLATAVPASHITRTQSEPTRRRGSLALADAGGSPQPFTNLTQPVLSSVRQVGWTYVQHGVRQSGMF
jgi:hypothetical protein